MQGAEAMEMITFSSLRDTVAGEKHPIASRIIFGDRQMAANCCVSVFNRALARLSNTSSHFFVICPAISMKLTGPDPR
jgi:hypothetical protein